MGLINAFGAIALDATVAATNTLLTAIRDRLAGTLDVRVTNQAGSVVEARLVPEPGRLLLANEVWTSPWVSVSAFAAASVLVNTDVGSAPNGAVLQFSIDGVAADPDKGVASTIPAGGGTFSFPPQAEYMRLQYTNGAAAQTRFRPEVILHYTAPGLVQQPIAAPITDANMAAVVRAAMAGRASTGQWKPILLADDGRVQVDVGTTQALTEAQLRSLPVAVDDADTQVALATLNGKDFATQATLAAVRSLLETEDFAQQSTLAAILAQVDDATADTLLSVLKALAAEDFATETTLLQLIPLLDGVEALLGAIRDELVPFTFSTTGRLRTLMVQPWYYATFGQKSIPTNAWTTVVETTPTTDATVTGYNADLAALTNVNYRQRLIRLDAAGALLETYHVSSTSASSVAWIPVHVNAPAGTRLAVQVFHGELAGQTFDGTLNWQERV